MKFNKDTEQELRFIDSIGTNTEQALGGLITREQLLEGYRAGCRKRTNWDKIDKHVVAQHTHEALLACQ